MISGFGREINPCGANFATFLCIQTSVNGPRRWTSISLLVAAAGGFALSVAGGAWWTVDAAFDIGPLGARQCSGDDCVPTPFWLDAGPRFERAATATAAAAGVAMVVLLAFAGALAAGRAPRLLRRMAMVALATAAAAATLWLVSFPGLPGAELGRGAMLYAGAIAAAIVAVAITKPAPVASG